MDRRWIDRGDVDALDRAWNDEYARVIGVSGVGAVDTDDEGPRWLCTQGPRPERSLYLGRTTTGPRFAVIDGAATGDGRTALAAASGEDREGLVTALALAQWHARERLCTSCGDGTVVAMGGWSRRCPTCAKEQFPRHDPAMIVAVFYEDRLLLGHSASWTPGRMSLLAGFVEAGESVEETVAREVAEEAGLQVRDIRYLGSQAWPFPRSLMLAFTATATSDVVRPDGVEVTEARFFSREELRAAIDDGLVSVPVGYSVAGRIIGSWLAGAPASLEH